MSCYRISNRRFKKVNAPDSPPFDQGLSLQDLRYGNNTADPLYKNFSCLYLFFKNISTLLEGYLHDFHSNNRDRDEVFC